MLIDCAITLGSVQSVLDRGVDGITIILLLLCFIVLFGLMFLSFFTGLISDLKSRWLDDEHLAGIVIGSSLQALASLILFVYFTEMGREFFQSIEVFGILTLFGFLVLGSLLLTPIAVINVLLYLIGRFLRYTVYFSGKFLSRGKKNKRWARCQVR